MTNTQNQLNPQNKTNASQKPAQQLITHNSQLTTATVAGARRSAACKRSLQLYYSEAGLVATASDPTSQLPPHPAPGV